MVLLCSVRQRSKFINLFERGFCMKKSWVYDLIGMIIVGIICIVISYIFTC